MEQNLCLVDKVFIKCARPEDLPDVFEMVDLYDSALKIDRTKTKNSLREILYNGGVFHVVLNGKTIGGIGAYILPCMFNDDLMFCIMFFFVKKEYRHFTPEIIRELELVLIPSKVTRIIYGFMAGEHHKKHIRFMRMMGYREFETHVSKSIQQQGAANDK